MLAGIEQFIGVDDAVSLMTDFVVKEMGETLPENMRADVEKFTREAWGLGQSFQVNGGDMAPRINEAALKFFGRLNYADYGKLFNGQKEIFRQSIQSALDGSSTRAGAIKHLKSKLNIDLTDKKMTGRVEDIFRNKIYTAQNFSRIERMNQVGVTEVEVVATMDQKTSAICRELNGRIFKTAEMLKFALKFISTPVDENFWDGYKQPTADELKSFPAMSSADILKQLNVKAPPFHFKCRTTIVMRTKTRIERMAGSGNQVPLAGKVEKPVKEPSGMSSLNRQRENELSGLSPDELLNKIANLQGVASWNPDNLQYHWDKRINDKSAFQIADTMEKYGKKALDVIKNFNMMYAYRFENSIGAVESKFGFMQMSEELKYFVPVNPETMEIDSLMVIDSPDFTKGYLRIL